MPTCPPERFAILSKSHGLSFFKYLGNKGFSLNNQLAQQKYSQGNLSQDKSSSREIRFCPGHGKKGSNHLKSPLIWYVFLCTSQASLTVRIIFPRYEIENGLRAFFYVRKMLLQRCGCDFGPSISNQNAQLDPQSRSMICFYPSKESAFVGSLMRWAH